jgi:hypothetical protein
LVLDVQQFHSTAGGQPSRTYYQMLDILPDEQDPKVIEEAALRCSSHVRIYQLTREAECTLRLNEIAQALITLLDPVRRREYDRCLGTSLSPGLSDRASPGSGEPPVVLQGNSASPAADEDRPVPLVVGGGSRDVKLVYQRRAVEVVERK